ncbi:MAG: exonuclease SbcCD subunit D C-terminal domain-containing protein [Myxococcota bacterium]
MRILHTSDWHLGHTLHDLPRAFEHARFLDWLADTIEAERVDALLVAGDVFDVANPPAAAQHTWFATVGGLRKRFPELEIVVIGGNHDSAARLDAPVPILGALGVHVVGGLPRAGGAPDADRLLVPLRGRGGEVHAWVAAVPFLREADLPVVDAEDRLVAGVAAVYAGVLDAARARRQRGQALLAMGHCYMVGGAISELSERKVLGGNQHALPAAIFPDDVAYAALGHLHLAQAVGGRDGVRYCGSPIPLSMAEAGYAHQVNLVDLDGEGLADVRALPVPRAVDMVRLDAGSLEATLLALKALPAGGALPEARWPWLEVSVQLARPEPTLRRQVDEALEGRAARLVRIATRLTGDGAALGDARPGLDLRAMTPEEVFRLKYAREYADPPSPALLAAFHELVQQVGSES